MGALPMQASRYLLATLAAVAGHPGFVHERVDICDAPAIRAIFARHQPCAVVHLLSNLREPLA